MKNNHLYFNINSFILIQLINFIFSQTLNNIIRLGDEDFRYSHFSFNSNKDMIIDSTSYPVSNERRFFGLTENGQFYFTINNQKTSYYSITMNYEEGRIEGESYFVKLTSSNNKFHGKELIYGISKIGAKNRGIYVDIYNLKDKNFTKYSTNTMFGNIISDSFTIIKTPNDTDSKYYYTLTYLVSDSSESTNYYAYIRKTILLLI